MYCKNFLLSLILGALAIGQLSAQCTGITAPFTENFNGTATPACWAESGSESWRYDTNAGYAAGSAGDHTGNGGNYAWIDGSFPSGAGQISTLTSPSVDISTLTNPEFRFWVFSLNTNQPTSYNTLTVEFYDGAAWNTVYTLQGSPSTTWHEVIINLATYTITGPVQVRFTIQENAPQSAFYNDILIDDISIDEAPPCPAPTALVASNVTANSADISWTPGAASLSTQIEVGPAGFTPGTAPVTATSNPFSVTGLAPATNYELYIREDCGGLGTSTWSGPISFTTACAVFTAPFVESFDAGSTPNCWTESGSESWRYSTTAGYAAGSAGDHTGNGGNYAWIDGSVPNGSGHASTLTSPSVDISSLNDAELRFWLFSYSSQSNATYNTLTVEFYDGAAWNTVYNLQGSPSQNWHEVVVSLSSYTITGNVQVRFTIEENAPSPSFPFYNDILIDDVRIDDAPVCAQASNINVTNITNTSGDIAWVDTAIAVNVDIEYGPAGFALGSGTTVNGVTSPYTLSGLSTATDYDFYLLTACSNSGTSIAAGSFTTDCPVIQGDSIMDAKMVNTLSFVDTVRTDVCYSNTFGNASPEVFYEVSLASCTESVDVSLCGSAFDTYLHILDAAGNPLTTNDDACGLQSELTGFAVTGNTTIYVVVEGFATASGDYNLSITQNQRDAQITLAQNTYCPTEADPSFTVTGETGGVFSEATGNVVVDSITGTIDLDASINGTYDILYTYTDATVGCVLTDTYTVTIKPTDIADISYANATYCTDQSTASAIVHSFGSGSFSASNTGLSLDASTGAIDISASTTGSYEVYFTTNGTCSSTDTAMVTIAEPSTDTLNITDCLAYSLNGETFNSSGTYTQVIPNAMGCDSVITLNLTLNASTATVNASDCGSYSLNGQTYNSSGTYTQTLTNSIGCDSILTINLTLADIDTSITQVGTTLSANESGAAYQWLDCDNNFAPIPFATTQTYGGNLANVAVEITKNGCTDRSNCYQLGTPINTNVTELEAGTVRYYPNPSDGILNIELAGVYENLRVEVLSPIGQVLSTYEPSATDVMQIELPKEAGWYLIRLRSDDSEHSFRVIRQR